MSSSIPSISIVIEWENAKNSELDRAHAMLTSLLGQVQRLSNRFSAAPELILVHDLGHDAADAVMGQIEPQLASFAGDVKVVVGDGEGYYDQKNLGARHANNELILFVDSDIVPEDSWLETLVDALIEEEADVAGGLTHISCTSFYERAFAAFWFFPVPGEVRGRGVSGGFAANNVLFRADVAKDNPFPDTGHVRGRCLRLAEHLTATGHKIVLEPEARVSHPPPNGLSHFVRRALCQGYDNKTGRTIGGKFITLRQFYWDMRRSSMRIARYHRNVGMNTGEAVGAVFVALAYYGVAGVGELISFVKPTLIPDRIRV